MYQPKKRLRWLVVAFMAVLAVTASSAALSAEFVGDEIYRLAEGEVVDDDLYIAATEIYIEGTVQGDLIAIASYIEIGPTGVVEGDLWIMAGINIVLAGGSILFFGRFIREKVRTEAPTGTAANPVVPGVSTIRMG